MIDLSILGVSVWGPGLEGWAASRPILAGRAPYQARPSPPPPPAVLAPTERRRSGAVVRLALAVAQEAAAGQDPAGLRAVFASSNGDGQVVGSILEALATGEQRVVSPTQFHNSVHNAAAGYWSIATGSRQPATCLGAHDATWAAGLLTAAADVAARGGAVLLCCYDHKLPPPLDALRPTEAPFAAALVLGAPGQDAPQLGVAFEAAAAEPCPLADPALQALAAGNAAGRALPLLVALARGEAGRHHAPYNDGRLVITVRP